MRNTEESNRKRQERWARFKGQPPVTQPVPMERWFEMPSKWTFEMPKLRAWVTVRLRGDVLNLFGGVTRLTGPTAITSITYNDLNPDIPADLRLDAYDLDQWASQGGIYDTIIFDPPYSAYQAVKSYGSKKAQLVTHARDVAHYVGRPACRIISLGFNSTGMGSTRGYTKEALALVNCGGSHNDYILLSEVRE